MNCWRLSGDYLSYQQDAVATEAYLGKARRRTSVRRHVRLIDYPMNDGRNARAWIHFDVRLDLPSLTVAKSTQVLTAAGPQSAIVPLGSDAYKLLLNQQPQAFELMESTTLYPEHNSMPFYTWGDRQCCLPAGTTTAWLRGSYPNLSAGTVLIFVETKSPVTGQAADADPSHRCAVRLTAVNFAIDPLGGECDEPPSSNPVAVTGIEWGTEDALPFPLCISSLTGTSYYDSVSVALGNNALSDNGRTISNEPLLPVPEPNPALVSAAGPTCDRCTSPALQSLKAARFNPTLSQSPLTFADPYSGSGSAYAAINSRQPNGLLPEITLSVPPTPDVWTPARDLLASAGDAEQFVAEVEDDGSATLRFGDGTYGMAPIPGTLFFATYRIGNGMPGSVGADSLSVVASNDPSLVSDLRDPVITGIRNPIPASGALDPETIDQVRQRRRSRSGRKNAPLPKTITALGRSK